MNRLTGKVAVISGGARGMGASHVRTFVEEGARVVFGDVREEQGRALAAEVGDDATFVPLDVTRADDWDRIVETAASRYGDPTVLINNAGIAIAGSVDDTSEEQMRRVLDINLLGNWLGIKAVLPRMRSAGGGSIINISSAAGLVGSPNSAPYVASKFGNRGLAKAVAMEVAGDNIRVNSVHPGFIDTPILGDGDQAVLDAARAMIPLHRVADPVEVSQLLVFLASDESRYSTGSEFVIDGGLTAG